MAKFTQLTLPQRYQLQTMHQLKLKQKDIARQLGLSESTVSRELRRNAGNDASITYQADLAQAQARQRCARAAYKLKGQLLKEVLGGLEHYHSPEQISGQLALKADQRQISHETIYRYVYRQTTQGQVLTKYLRIRHRKHYKKRGEVAKRGQIPGRVGIEHRPAIVETNTEIGHWEGDTVIGFDHSGGPA